MRHYLVLFMLGVAPVPGGLYFFRPASQCPSSGWMLPPFLLPLGQSPFPFSWVLGKHVFVCRCTSFQFPHGKNNRRWLSCVLFLSLPVCACCLLCGTFAFGLLDRSCLYIHVPIIECVHPRDVHWACISCRSVCLCVCLSLCVCLCVSVLGGVRVYVTIWDHRGFLYLLVSVTFQFVLHLSIYIFVQGILLWTLIF